MKHVCYIGNSEFKSSLKEDFLRMEVKMESLRGEIKDSKADMIKWVAAIIIGQTVLLITLIKLFK